MERKDHVYLPEMFQIYLESLKDTETYPLFHVGALASFVGAVLNRKIKLNRGSALPPLYPNLWCVLVAPQGVGHKSSAIKMAYNLVHKAGVELKILSAKMTPEALVKALAHSEEATVQGGKLVITERDAIGVVMSSEFGVLLGRQQYNTGMTALLTDLYDSPDEWSSETITRGKDKLKNVCLSLIAASTPDWMQSMLPEDVYLGGFMSRILVIAQPFGWYKRVPFPDLSANLEPVVERIKKIATLRGEVVLSQEARKKFEQWYTEDVPNLAALPVGLVAYYSRKQEHLLKLSVIYEASRGEPFKEVSLESFEMALQTLAEIEVGLKNVMDYITASPKTRVLRLVEQILEAKGEIEDWVLAEMVRPKLTTPNELDQAIAFLIRTKKIEIITKGGEIHYVYKQVQNRRDNQNNSR